MRPIQWHLKNNWRVPESLEKGDSNTKVLAPTFTMVAARGQWPLRPTFTPNKTCSANLYRRINRRVGCSLKQTHCKRHLVPSGKQVAYQLPRTKMRDILAGPTCPVRQLMSLIGLLTATEKQVHLGRLHMRPIQ